MYNRNLFRNSLWQIHEFRISFCFFALPPPPFYALKKGQLVILKTVLIGIVESISQATFIGPCLGALIGTVSFQEHLVHRILRTGWEEGLRAVFSALFTGLALLSRALVQGNHQPGFCGTETAHECPHLKVPAPQSAMAPWLCDYGSTPVHIIWL